VTGAGSAAGSARLHGPGCRVAWGWDREHSDSDRPYTVDELAARHENPHFYAYPDEDAYLRGWNLWRALRRDGELNSAELDVVTILRTERVLARLGAEMADLVRAELGEGYRRSA
jgi:hypothetical protein